MIPSFVIKNYRNLEHLQIPSLGRVNLITGKNNTGKTALLEAISIYIAKADLNWIISLLNERGEYYGTNEVRSLLEMSIKSISSMFYGRNPDYYNEKDAIVIGRFENTLFGSEYSSDLISLRIILFTEEVFTDKDSMGRQQDVIRRERKVINNRDESAFSDYQVGFEIYAHGSKGIISLDAERNYRLPRLRKVLPFPYYIRAYDIGREVEDQLWGKIALTPKEDEVVKALQIIEPSIERITFINNHTNNREERSAVIKLRNQKDTIPLKSMGDGINRVLSIILALVNADNNCILIDEIENGLHYTVQKQLWEIIFQLAYKLDIQVFATTHSSDCISAFESVLNSDKVYTDSKMIRLDLVDGKVKEVEYTAEDLKVIVDQDIEAR